MINGLHVAVICKHEYVGIYGWENGTKDNLMHSGNFLKTWEYTLLLASSGECPPTPVVTDRAESQRS